MHVSANESGGHKCLLYDPVNVFPFEMCTVCFSGATTWLPAYTKREIERERVRARD